MLNASSFRNRGVIILTVFLLVTLFNLVNGHSNAETEKNPPGTIMIDLPTIDDENQMPAVRFLHDRHEEALKGQKDCSACHLQKDNRFIFKFKRMENGTVKTDMDIYHANCIGCHKEVADAGKPSGPVTGECRLCHRRITESGSSWTKLSFSRSLHYRHESSTLIKPAVNSDTANCSACHHKYNKETRELYYQKGEEESCMYCHKSSSTDNVRSMRNAAHDSCVNCHQKMSANNQKSGPVNCLGCHDAAEQKKIKVIENVPRLKRNQPDKVLLSNWMAESTEGGDPPVSAHVNPVPFNHAIHENNTSSCIACHHASLDRCGTCHSSFGSDKGHFITLEQSMHDGNSEKSCVGCHNQKKTHKNCAGCHALIPDKRAEDLSCHVCHSVTGDPSKIKELSKKEKEKIAGKALGKKKRGHILIPDDKIPDKVSIGIMKDKYEAVDFPHRQIVKKLYSGIKKSQMAGYFHESEITLCAACHHNSAPTETPPACAACHRKNTGNVQNERPGLMGAYHGQCITCHQKMDIKEPAATDCIGCHKKRTAAVIDEG